jgi:hypothetical protein
MSYLKIGNLVSRTKPHKVEQFYEGNEADRTIYRVQYLILSNANKGVRTKKEKPRWAFWYSSHTEATPLRRTLIAFTLTELW